MKFKTALLATLGAMVIAAPAAAQPRNDSGYRHHHHRHYVHERRGCHLAKRPRYGVFGQLHNRLTIVC
ncbi:MAG TPA: hypothetical protein VGN38_12175 [Caulobacteraceae bacterium]|jgi:hypothetical protein|nr:hypothetical protein [Caulobacteraceae bacterium]